MKNTNSLTQKRIAGIAVMLAVALTTSCQLARGQAATNAAAAAAAAPAAPATNVVSLTPPVRIKPGVTEKWTDAAGNVWLPDQGSTDGEIGRASCRERG